MSSPESLQPLKRMQELRKCITGPAFQCQKTLKEFANMRKTFREFQEMQIEQERPNVKKRGCLSAVQFMGLAQYH